MELNKIAHYVSLLSSDGPGSYAYVENKLREEGLELSKLCHSLEMSFTGVEYLRDEGTANPLCHIHSHTFYEIVFCHSNCGAQYLVKDRRYSLQRGDIILIPPETDHASLVKSASEEPYVGCLVWISKSFIEYLQAAFPIFQNYHEYGAAHLRTSGTVWEYLEVIFQTAISESELQMPGWESSLTAITVLLLTQICRAIDSAEVFPAPSKNPELLDQILSYVESSLSAKITVDDVANRFWVSTSTVANLFKNKLGISFYKYVTQRRLAEAKNLIREGLPMETIAAKVGFGDYSAFYRAFKNEFGISPRQLSKLIAVSAEQLSGR